MNDTYVFAAVQNGVILDVFNTKEEAVNRVRAEIQRDIIQIICKRHLRKLLAKTGDVALHKYSVLLISGEEEIK